MQTTESCESCHVITAWKPASTVDHTQVTGTCVSCHDGTTATGKPANHIPSDSACGTCHATTAWKPARFTHDGLTATCVSCHDGVRETGKSARTSSRATPARPATPPSAGARRARRPRAGDGQLLLLPQRHDRHRQERDAPASSNDCAACHATQAWKPATRVDHAQVLGTCSSCHNGTHRRGQDREPHRDQRRVRRLPRDDRVEAGDVRSLGHQRHLLDLPRRNHGHRQAHDATSRRPRSAAAATRRAAWKPARFTHDGITAACVSCHDGVEADGKSSTHIQATDACQACHTTTAWRPVLRVDHAQVTGSCYSCHNGTIATGKKPGHILSTQQLRRLPRDAGLDARDDASTTAR